MTRISCPECGHRLGLGDDDDAELAMYLHSLSGRCAGRPGPKKVTDVSRPTHRFVTLAEELDAVTGP